VQQRNRQRFVEDALLLKAIWDLHWRLSPQEQKPPTQGSEDEVVYDSLHRSFRQRPPSLPRFDVCCILRRLRLASESLSPQSLMTSKTSTDRLNPLTILELTTCPTDQIKCSTIVPFWLLAPNQCSFSNTNKASCSNILLVRTHQDFTSSFLSILLKCGNARSIGPRHLARTRIAASYPKSPGGRLVFLVPHKLPQPT
jgi:hypothetical protein